MLGYKIDGTQAECRTLHRRCINPAETSTPEQPLCCLIFSQMGSSAGC